MGAADNAVLPAARNQHSKRHCGQHISLVASPANKRSRLKMVENE